MITSFEMENFRKFSHWKCEGIRPVNVIVGSIASGKTSFLEAICAFLYQEDMLSFVSQFAKGDLRQSLSSFFHQKNIEKGFTLGANNEYIRHKGNASLEQFEWICHGKSLYFSSKLSLLQRLNTHPRLFFPSYELIEEVELFRSIESSGHLLILNQALRWLDPVITGVVCHGERVYVCNREYEIPLCDSGRGVQRLFQLVCGFAYNRDGIFCIDDVAAGFHPLVFDRLPLILKDLARLFHVQLFVTVLSNEQLLTFIDKYDESSAISAINVNQEKCVPSEVILQRRQKGISLF